MAINKDNGSSVNSGFADKLLPQLRHFGLREFNWLWNFLPNSGWQWSALWYAENLASLENRVVHLNNQIFNNQSKDAIIAQILAVSQATIINQKYLEWIDESNERLMIWLINEAFKVQILFSTYIAGMSRYEFFVRSLDLSNYPLDYKIQFILNCKEQWGRIQALDGQTKWINSSDLIQNKWAWNYLTKAEKAVLIQPPVTLQEVHCAVIASIDALLYEHSANRELFLLKMKKTWSQKKFRDSGKAKKPYHLPLTEATKKKLDELAKLNDCKTTAMLEQLIKEAYAKQIQDDKGKTLFKS